MTYILNLPLDILAIIIAHVEPHDLCRIALVSRLLNSLATPKIYEEVIYGDALAQNWGKVLCPLKTLNSRPDLLVRLKSLDLTSVPWDEPDKNHSAPEFFVSYQEVLKTAQNLQRLAIGRYEDGFLGELICTPNELISSAQDQPKTRGSALLHLPSSIEYLLLRQPGESIIHGLVTLANSSQLSGLTNLRIIANDCLLPAELSTILTNTPNLKALGIIRCACITLLNLLSSIGHLKLDLLEFGWGSRNGGLERPQISFPSLPMLREISLRNIPVVYPSGFGHDQSRSATKDQLLYVLHNICCATLSSLCLGLVSLGPGPTHDIIYDIVVRFGSSLHELDLCDSAISAQQVKVILQGIPQLKKLGIAFGDLLDDLDVILKALPGARHLHTIVDNTYPYSGCMPDTAPPVLSVPQIEQLLETGPKLREVISYQYRHKWVKSYERGLAKPSIFRYRIKRANVKSRYEL